MGGILRRPIESPSSLTGTLTVTATDPSGSYDILIGDIPFMASYTDSHPYLRETAAYRKEQQDQASEPGEQSLEYWWLRSQSTFHGGAGRLFEEPATASDLLAPIQFQTCQGVNPWVPGKVTLQRKTIAALALATGSGCIGTMGSGSTPTILSWAGTTLKAVAESAPDTFTSTAITYGGASAVQSVCSDGTNYYAAATDGIYKGALPAGAGSKIYSVSGSPAMIVAWVKQRLMLGRGPDVYQLQASPGGAPVTLPSGTSPIFSQPVFTHPNPAWTWTAFAEGPGAIYAAGYAGEQSAVFKFVLDSTNGVPTLSSGITGVQMPYSELITAMFTYIGGYVVLGTNRGVRVCAVQTNGTDLILGALSVNFSTFAPAAGPVLGLAGRDRFVYAAFSNGHADGTSGLVRIDLSQLVDTNSRFAFAPDLQSHVAGTITGVTNFGDRMAFSQESSQLYVESALQYETSGTLTTGKIRYHTLDDKIFKYLKMRALPLVGQLQATVVDATGGSNVLQPVSQAGQSPLPDQQIGIAKQEYVALQFTLTASGGATGTPTFQGYQLKALPGAKRQRQEMLSLLCNDLEKDRNGMTFGYAGYALSRLMRLETLEEAGDVTVLQHLTADPEGLASRSVVIDQVRFNQTVNPTRKNGWGGVVEITVRSVT